MPGRRAFGGRRRRDGDECSWSRSATAVHESVTGEVTVAPFAGTMRSAAAVGQVRSERDDDECRSCCCWSDSDRSLELLAEAVLVTEPPRTP